MWDPGAQYRGELDQDELQCTLKARGWEREYAHRPLHQREQKWGGKQDAVRTFVDRLKVFPKKRDIVRGLQRRECRRKKKPDPVPADLASLRNNVGVIRKRATRDGSWNLRRKKAKGSCSYAAHPWGTPKKGGVVARVR